MPTSHRPTLLLALLASALACTGPPPRPDPDGRRPALAPDRDAHAAEVEAWHRGRVERLRREDGWLATVGLHWLEEGRHRLGSAPDADVVLPAGHAPERVGELVVTPDEVRLGLEPGVPMTHDGEPVTGEVILATDASGTPTVLQHGSVRFHVIDRDGRRALRVRDAESEQRRRFTGIARYPVDPRWLVAGRLVDEPGEVALPTVLGTRTRAPSPGAVEFDWQGQRHRLTPVRYEGSDSLFFVFADATSGKETYGGGRFLYAALPDEEGRVLLDFNRAYNPPCAFTDFATCPLPPPGNTLPFPVRAGEKAYGAH